MHRRIAQHTVHRLLVSAVLALVGLILAVSLAGAVDPRVAAYGSTPPTTWTPNQTQTYPITITNNGSESWNATGDNPVRLSVHFGQASDTPHNGWATDQRIELPNDVSPGASVTFAIVVTAPATTGSYVLRHRMVKEGVQWFDQIQKTDVAVGYPRAADYISSPATAWNGGETKSYSITVTNIGTEGWSATGDNRVRLSVHFGQASDTPHDGWATDDRFALPNDVAPGASATITVTVAAPPFAGGYVLRHRMVKEGVAWFDQLQKTDVTVAAGPPVPSTTRVATYTVSPPTAWLPGETKSYSITVTNNGTENWNASGTDRVRLGIHFGQASDAPHDGWATDQRFGLPADVAPGASATLTANVAAPSDPGAYVLRHCMVKETVGWFDQDPSGKIPNIQVGFAPPPSTPALAYQLSGISSPTPPDAPWRPGETRTFDLQILNIGSESWYSNPTDGHNVRLGVQFSNSNSDAPGDGWITDQRFDIPASQPGGVVIPMSMYGTPFAQPGQIPAVNFTGIQVTAPTTPGSYYLRFRMVKEGSAWFDQASAASTPPSPAAKIPNIQVGFAPPPSTPALAYQLSGISSPTPPDAPWRPGETRTFDLQILNIGSESWYSNPTDGHNVRLGVQFSNSNSDAPGDGWITDQRFDIPASQPGGVVIPMSMYGTPFAQPGQIPAVNFTGIQVTAPTTPGSYYLRFRMVKEGSAWFDQASAASTPPSPAAKIPNIQVGFAPPPSTPALAYAMQGINGPILPDAPWSPGETRTFDLQILNIGSESWYSNPTDGHNVRLGVQFSNSNSDAPGDGWITDQRFDIPASQPGGVAIPMSMYGTPFAQPGQIPAVNFTGIQVTAPTTPGIYYLRFRMVKEGSAWFDQASAASTPSSPAAKIPNIQVTGSTYDATYTPNIAPSSWTPGQTQQVSVTVTNTGAVAWSAGGSNPVRLGIHFGTDSDIPHDGWATDERHNLPSGDVPVGGSATFVVNATAPTVPGSYRMHFRMVTEGVAWFDSLIKPAVTVAP